MTERIPESHPLRRLFHGLTEHTFQTELGIADVRLVEYVAQLLARFVPSEGVWKLRDERGRRLSDLASMWVQAASGPDEHRADSLRHIGDFTLFWTGVFPEALSTRQAHVAAQTLIDYQQQGKRSYLLASTYCEDSVAVTLRRLSAEFELCAFGLSCVRREWERLEPPAGGADPRTLLLS
jgi:hypothetical protein